MTMAMKDIPTNMQDVADVLIPTSARTIGSCAFASCGMREITIPASVKEIQPQAFIGCRNLKQVVILSENSHISEDAFEDCNALCSIIIPKGKTSWYAQQLPRNKEQINESIVYFSALFAEDYPTEFRELADILDRNNVDCQLLPNTKDYWCRDYMPVISGNGLTQFVYTPDYLAKKQLYQTIPKEVTDVLGIRVNDSDIIADGGNFTQLTYKDGGKLMVVTEKIFEENPQYAKDYLAQKLCDLFEGYDFLFIAWDKLDKCGHTDGMVHRISDGRVLVNLELYKKAVAKETRAQLEERFEVVDLKISDYHKYSWAYINFLQTDDVIIVPALGLPTDEEALAQIKSLYPQYEGRIFQVNIASVIQKWGGALNCLTWNTTRNRLLKNKQN